MTSSTDGGSSTYSAAPSCSATVAIWFSSKYFAPSPTVASGTLVCSKDCVSINTKSSPSLYRYCISRRSTLAVSTFTPALKVLSTTLPESTFFSFVRTNAGPLPGLTCWNSTTDQSTPSMLSTSPFFRSFVVATRLFLLRLHQIGQRTRITRADSVQDQQFLGGQGQQLRPVDAHHQGVLDAHPTLAGQVHTGFHGHRAAGRQRPGSGRGNQWRFMDLQTDAVPEPVPAVLPVPGLGDHRAGGRVHRGHLDTRSQRLPTGPLRGENQVVDLHLPVRRVGSHHERTGHVRVIAVEPGAEIDLQQVALQNPPVGGTVVRDRRVRPRGHDRSEEHTSELQSRQYLVCRLLLEKKKKIKQRLVINKKKISRYIRM